MEDKFLLQRFIQAQSHLYPDVVSELKQGRKINHWMWFVFPQVKGLGRTATADKYAIKSIEEAKAYIAHPILGNRLRECTELVLEIDGCSANQIFGYPDDLKFKSSITLFQQISEDNKIFKDAIFKYFDGQEDVLTIDILKDWKLTYG